MNLNDVSPYELEGGRKSIRTLSVNDLKSLYEALGVGYSTAPSSSVEIMVVYAYATWCGYCQRGMPIFNDQVLRSNTKFAFFFNASTPDRRAAFKTITGQDINKFPTIFVFYGTSKGRKASQMVADGNYTTKFHKLKALMGF